MRPASNQKPTSRAGGAKSSTSSARAGGSKSGTKPATSGGWKAKTTSDRVKTTETGAKPSKKPEVQAPTPTRVRSSE